MNDIFFLLVQLEVINQQPVSFDFKTFSKV